MAEFHFLRPAWLLLLPLIVWAAWRVGLGRGGASGWRAVVDRALQPFVLSGGERVGQRRWPLLTALAAGALAAFALAGPAWDRAEVPTFRSADALVVALDLSRSMDAGDLEPSRLTRARLKLLDLLEQRDSGETALVVFSSNAFVVTPLTNDTRAISLLVGALDTSLMPSRGSLIEVGLAKSAELLEQSTAGSGDILLMTDATASPAALELAADLRERSIVTHVLGVGTAEGAPIPESNGGFVTDAAGRVVVPQLNSDNLSRLAAAGGGRFAQLAIGDSDIETILAGTRAGAVAEGADGEQRTTEVWRDRGAWLALALLPLLALGFRRGWVYGVVAGLMLPLPRAEAFDWRDLWRNPDQQGRAAFEQDAPATAAELFEDPEWEAASRYRAGQYAISAELLAGLDTPTAHYNRGNALARAGQLADAITAYDRALELEPGHADAEYNRELVAELLEQEQQQQQQQQSSEQGEQGEQGDEADTGDSAQQNESGSPEQSGSDGEGAQSAGATPEPDGSQGDQSGQQDPADQDAPGEEQLADDGAADEAAGADGEDPLEAMPALPEGSDDWASEQAAEQWLRRIPQDPGGLLRRKFLYQYQQEGVDQDGNRIYRGGEAEPW